MNRLSLAVSLTLLASGAAAAVIVEQAKPAPTYESVLARSWENVHDKILAMAKEIVYTHHEKWDGTGYPNGLKGPDIPVPGRVMAVSRVNRSRAPRRTTTRFDSDGIG